MDLRIAGKIALVTGSSSGLGRACGLALAAEGARVAFAARRVPELERACQEARAAGAPDARAFTVDLEDAQSIQALVADVRSAFGTIDILVANGGGPKSATATGLSLDDWDTGYRNVLRSMLQLVGLVTPEMRGRRWGRIVALTSTSVKQPIATLALSNVFRTALVAALKSLSSEIAADGVTVNSIATGRILTDRLRSLYGNDEAALQKAAREVPIGRIAEPAELAALVAFLCGDPAAYVTGQTIAVDGGLVGGLFG